MVLNFGVFEFRFWFVCLGYGVWCLGFRVQSL